MASLVARAGGIVPLTATGQSATASFRGLGVTAAALAGDQDVHVAAAGFAYVRAAVDAAADVEAAQAITGAPHDPAVAAEEQARVVCAHDAITLLLSRKDTLLHRSLKGALAATAAQVWAAVAAPPRLLADKLGTACSGVLAEVRVALANAATAHGDVEACVEAACALAQVPGGADSAREALMSLSRHRECAYALADLSRVRARLLASASTLFDADMRKGGDADGSGAPHTNAIVAEATEAARLPSWASHARVEALAACAVAAAARMHRAPSPAHGDVDAPSRAANHAVEASFAAHKDNDSAARVAADEAVAVFCSALMRAPAAAAQNDANTDDARRQRACWICASLDLCASCASSVGWFARPSSGAESLLRLLVAAKRAQALSSHGGDGAEKASANAASGAVFEAAAAAARGGARSGVPSWAVASSARAIAALCMSLTEDALQGEAKQWVALASAVTANISAAASGAPALVDAPAIAPATQLIESGLLQADVGTTAVRARSTRGAAVAQEAIEAHVRAASSLAAFAPSRKASSQGVAVACNKLADALEVLVDALRGRSSILPLGVVNEAVVASQTLRLVDETEFPRVAGLYSFRAPSDDGGAAARIEAAVWRAFDVRDAYAESAYDAMPSLTRSVEAIGERPAVLEHSSSEQAPPMMRQVASLGGAADALQADVCFARAAQGDGAGAIALHVRLRNTCTESAGRCTVRLVASGAVSASMPDTALSLDVHEEQRIAAVLHVRCIEFGAVHIRVSVSPEGRGKADVELFPLHLAPLDFCSAPPSGDPQRLHWPPPPSWHASRVRAFASLFGVLPHIAIFHGRTITADGEGISLRAPFERIDLYAVSDTKRRKGVVSKRYACQTFRGHIALANLHVHGDHVSVTMRTECAELAQVASGARSYEFWSDSLVCDLADEFEDEDIDDFVV